MIDCCLRNTKAKLFFLCAYLEPDNIANCKLAEFNILQRVLCTAAAISFNRPAGGRDFFLRHCVQAPSGTHSGFHPLGIGFFFNPRVIEMTREVTVSLLVLRVRIRGPILPFPH